MFDLRRVKTRREELDLTQAEVAARAKITIATLSRIENGHTKFLHPKTYENLVTALRLEPGELLK